MDEDLSRCVLVDAELKRESPSSYAWAMGSKEDLSLLSVGAYVILKYFFPSGYGSDMRLLVCIRNSSSRICRR